MIYWLGVSTSSTALPTSNGSLSRCLSTWSPPRSVFISFDFHSTSLGGRPPPTDEAGIAETGSASLSSATGQVDRYAGISILTRRGPATAPLSTFDKDIGWAEIEITIDSGACDTVRPSRMLQHIAITPSEDSLKGLEYEVANGETLPNVGDKHCVMMTEDSQSAKLITFQCADIHKPLLSVSSC